MFGFKKKEKVIKYLYSTIMKKDNINIIKTLISVDTGNKHHEIAKYLIDGDVLYMKVLKEMNPKSEWGGQTKSETEKEYAESISKLTGRKFSHIAYLNL